MYTMDFLSEINNLILSYLILSYYIDLSSRICRQLCNLQHDCLLNKLWLWLKRMNYFT